MLTLLAVVAQPLGEAGLRTGLTPRYEASRANKAKDGMGGHKSPLLLRTMDHAVDQVPIADACRSLLRELQSFEVVLLARVRIG